MGGLAHHGLLAALLLAASPARAGEGLSVRAEPGTLLLGEGGTATLVVEASAGAPAPLVTANLGTIEELAPAGPGRWTARYRPPAKRYPQVALVGAVAGERQGFTAILLVGQGEALIQARPNQRIDSVRIGERSFGPFQADARGDARVPVQVPPGVTHAYHAGKAIDLGLPATPHLHLAVDRPTLPADQAATLRLFVWAVTPEGRPRPAAPVELRAGMGEVSALSPAGPGVQTALWKLPPGATGGTAPWTTSLSAVLKDEPGQLRTLVLPRPAGKPARFTLETNRTRHVAGEPDLVIRGAARDTAGNPVAPEFALAASLGSLSTPRATGPGDWEWRLSVPPAFAGATQVRLTAASPTGEVLAELTLPLVAGAPQLLLAPPEAATTADGRSRVALGVKAQDSFGNPTAEVPRVRAAKGHAELAPGAPGEWTVDYRAPSLPSGGTDEVVVELGGLSARGRVALAPGMARFEAAPKLGFVGNEAVGGALLGLEAGYRFSLLEERFAVLLEGSWYRLSRDEEVDGLTLHGRHDFVTVLASAHWRKPFGASGQWMVSIGAGLGFVQSFSKLTVEGQPAERAEGLGLSYHATFGVQRRAPLGGPFLEVRYWRNGNLGAPAVRGQLGSVLVDVGYRFEAF